MLVGLATLASCSNAPPEVTREPDIPPVAADPTEISAETLRCIEARTGIDGPPAGVTEGEPLPLYYSIAIGCRIVAGETGLPGPFVASFTEDNEWLLAVGRCLAAHGWSETASLLDGVGGASRPDSLSSGDAAKDLEMCGFWEPPDEGRVEE